MGTGAEERLFQRRGGFYTNVLIAFTSSLTIWYNGMEKYYISHQNRGVVHSDDPPFLLHKDKRKGI